LPWFADEASVVAPGKVAIEDLDFNHAALVAGSTGHASAGNSKLLAIPSLRTAAVSLRNFGDVEKGK
jgi:hypothetical protein